MCLQQLKAYRIMTMSIIRLYVKIMLTFLISFIIINISICQGSNSEMKSPQISKQYSYDIVVAQDGSGNYKTVQEAFDAVGDKSDKRTIIFIKKGMYKEKLVLKSSKQNITIIGEDVDSTILTFDDYSGKVVGNYTLGTFTSYSFAVQADGFVAENITFENAAGPVGQAVAVMVKSDKVVFNNCRFLGNQDTFYTQGTGRCYLSTCYIEGTTDFIFGSSITVFKNCNIVSKKNSYITAASTPEGYKYGYVFFNCKLQAVGGIDSVYLGRPWRPFAKTVFIQCDMGRHIRPEGWHHWKTVDNKKTAYYAEYKCFGPGSDRTGRVIWSKQLTDEEASEYTIGKIFSVNSTINSFKDNWEPQEK
jgi:pectinesterase